MPGTNKNQQTLPYVRKQSMGCFLQIGNLGKKTALIAPILIVVLLNRTAICVISLIYLYHFMVL